MRAGLEKHGIEALNLTSINYRGVRGDAAVFYGFANKCPRIFRDYRARDLPVINIDLGYWGRDKRKKMDGYNKVAVNSRHPTEYFQAREHPKDRWRELQREYGLKIKPWRKEGEYILVCGMSSKAAAAAGLRFLHWEQAMIEKLRAHTDMPIVFRSKPNRKAAPSYIKGVDSLPHDWSIEQCLERAHVCVARHSNACADALLAGVPVLCEEGVASPFSIRVGQINEPPLMDGRRQWAYDVAYCQWTLREMQSGLLWEHLQSEGLV